MTLSQQLEIHSRTGSVSLKNLRLNCDLLNEYMSTSPLRVVEAEMGELQASISYDTLLSDGCNITCRRLVLVFAPAVSPTASARRKSTGAHKTPFSADNRTHSQKDSSSKKHTPTPNQSNEESSPNNNSSNSSSRIFSSQEDLVTDDSLGFIAQWIEVIIARLQVTLSDLHILLLDTTQVETASVAMHMQFRHVTFYNSHPRLMHENGASVLAASMVGTSAEQSRSFIDAMNTRKVWVCVGGVWGGYV